MTSHGLRTVSSSHFGSATDQALFLIRMERKYLGLSFLGHVRALQCEWDGSVVRGLQLQTFDRR